MPLVADDMPSAWQLAFEAECDVAFRAWGLEQYDRLAALKAQGAL
jgi:hypothetical protein